MNNFVPFGLCWILTTDEEYLLKLNTFKRETEEQECVWECKHDRSAWKWKITYSVLSEHCWMELLLVFELKNFEFEKREKIYLHQPQHQQQKQQYHIKLIPTICFNISYSCFLVAALIPFFSLLLILRTSILFHSLILYFFLFSIFG